MLWVPLMNAVSRNLAARINSIGQMVMGEGQGQGPGLEQVVGHGQGKEQEKGQEQVQVQGWGENASRLRALLFLLLPHLQLATWPAWLDAQPCLRA